MGYVPIPSIKFYGFVLEQTTPKITNWYFVIDVKVKLCQLTYFFEFDIHAWQMRYGVAVNA